jgi:hypothetical protein
MIDIIIIDNGKCIIDTALNFVILFSYINFVTAELSCTDISIRAYFFSRNNFRKYF